MNCEAHLSEMVRTGNTPRGFADLLNGWQQHPDEDANDRNHNQQLNQRERIFIKTGSTHSANIVRCSLRRSNCLAKTFVGIRTLVGTCTKRKSGEASDLHGWLHQSVNCHVFTSNRIPVAECMDTFGGFAIAGRQWKLVLAPVKNAAFVIPGVPSFLD